MPAGTQRGELWIPLLLRLTERLPEWTVWKNVESALTGNGDIDSAAPAHDWPAIEEEFQRWATEFRLGPVIVCRHIPGGLNLCAVPPDMETLLEVGIKTQKVWRGTTLFLVDQIKPLTYMDPRGFRRVRAGAEGFFKLLLNGTRWSGAADATELRNKHVPELLRSDPDGARMAAAVFGPATPIAIAGAWAAAAGNWDRAAMLILQAWALLKSFAEPATTARRAWFRLTAKQRCPVVATLLRDHRRIPANREQWLNEVSQTHKVYNWKTDSLPRNLEPRHAS